MTRKTFDTGNGFGLHCIIKESINHDLLENIAAELKLPQTASLTSTGAATQTLCQINSVRFFNCQITADHVSSLLQLPNLQQIEFVNSPLQSNMITQLSIQGLQIAPTFKLSRDISAEERELLADPFLFHGWIQNWRRNWLLGSLENTPSPFLNGCEQYQQAIATATDLQMRFFNFMLMNAQNQTALFADPAWLLWKKDVTAHLHAVKKIRTQLGKHQYERALDNLLEDLLVEMRLFAPPFASTLNEHDQFAYFQLLNQYRNVRFHIIEATHCWATNKSCKISQRAFTILLNQIDLAAKTQDHPALEQLAFASITLLYRFAYQIKQVAHDTNQPTFTQLLAALTTQLHRWVDRKVKLNSWSSPLHNDIYLGLFFYFNELDSEVLSLVMSGDMKHTVSVFNDLMNYLVASIDSRDAKLVFSLMLKTIWRPQQELVENLFVYYFSGINSRLYDYTKLIVIDPKKTLFLLPCYRSEQHWLLEHYYEIACLMAKCFEGRAVIGARDFESPSARQHLSKKYHTQHPEKFQTLRFADPPGAPQHTLYQPTYKNRILDQLPGQQERRMFFEKVMHYLLNNLQRANDYYTAFDAIVQSRLNDPYPAFVFDPYSAISCVKGTTSDIHLSNYIQLLLSVYTILKSPGIDTFKIGKFSKIEKFTSLEWDNTQGFLQKGIILCTQLLKPEVVQYLQKNLPIEESMRLIITTTDMQFEFQEQLTNLQKLIAEYKTNYKIQEEKSWDIYVTHIQKQPNQVRCIKRPPRVQKSNSAPENHIKKSAPKVAPSPPAQPTYLSVYPILKPIHTHLEQGDFAAVLSSVNTLLDLLMPIKSGMSEDINNYPVLAYLYYVIADCMRISEKRNQIDERLIYNYLLQGYRYAQKIAELQLACDPELLDIFSFLIQEVETSAYFVPQTVSQVKTEEPSADYHCELTPTISALLPILFKHFVDANLFFYGSFVLTALIRQIHNLHYNYSDVDIVIFVDDLAKAYQFMSAQLPGFKPCSRPGLFRGTLLKMPFDIQILDAACHSPVSFAKSLGVACRAGMATFNGKCLDMTGQTFADIHNKKAVFLPETDLVTNQLAIFLKIRSQAQYAFDSDAMDDKKMLAQRTVLLTKESWLLRDHFSRHFQQGFAVAAIKLWYQYEIFSLLLPLMSTLTYNHFLPLCEQLDADYAHFQSIHRCTILFLLAKFLQVYVEEQKPTLDSVQSVITNTTIHNTAPLLQDLPVMARAEIGDLILYGLKQKGFFVKKEGEGAQRQPGSPRHAVLPSGAEI